MQIQSDLGVPFKANLSQPHRTHLHLLCHLTLGCSSLHSHLSILDVNFYTLSYISNTDGKLSRQELDLVQVPVYLQLSIYKVSISPKSPLAQSDSCLLRGKLNSAGLSTRYIQLQLKLFSICIFICIVYKNYVLYN